MTRFIVNRVLTALVSMLGIALVIFVVTQMLPGDAARVQAGQYATEAQVEALREKFGLDRPLIVQLGTYLAGLAQFDFGTSTRTGQPVLQELMTRLPATLELSLAALLVALVIGVLLGVAAAARQGRIPDLIARIVTITASSTATFWIALLAIVLFCNTLGWFPSPIGRLPRGFAPPPGITGMYTVDSLLTGDLALFAASLSTIALPAIILGIVASPSIIKVVRAATIRALASDFARTSRSFGYSPASILFRDGLRNSLLPVLTTIGIVTGFLLGGNVIIEQLFSWPGIGQYAYQALQSHDLNALRGFALIVGIVYVTLNMVLDILYTFVDPRVQFKAAA
ncbi:MULTISPECIES: ABC transporter permease [unclassified Microbacterium]|uniref:ABC transporter permease n=1 Tax=unclassified Microbacterium TaxID=2609290 RepID=UPI00214B538D|nr:MULTISPECIES: ABC transporter permease [unclassified Microbacterium]MCR2810633.1 ABC transporter permease [Microbacterium sp. zg.B185]WIM18170.1 ABC transporter permease [Microbacterium sp. zg-B185]